MVAIKINNLRKEYETKVAVDDLNLEINEGEIFALLGVNGAGKTTTIKMLSGYIEPTSGEATILDKNISKDMREIKKQINVSPQETAIAPNLTVRENLEFIAGIYGIKKENIKKSVDEIIQKFKLEEVEKSKTKTLSGGWQRRLSIAMAIISNPKILFLDEPTLGLDVLARRELWKIIEGLKGTTIILTTHYMEEAESLSDRIGIMNKGRIIEVGTAEELIKIAEAKNFEDAFVKIATEEIV